MKHKISYSIYIHYADSREKKKIYQMHVEYDCLKNGFEAASWCVFVFFFNNHGCSDQNCTVSIFTHKITIFKHESIRKLL